ncbi:TetR/AcrR family transcriptional regulator [Chitinophaga rhizophila]|uniref:TetR/AcrR family transcriptional regulator n=1 Tax=Chitinophaga rhizophila TaxID=2866212 RepID=A0ABS7GL43_9BACT|nr:TetR/AcrR family transcriptional regulator [Chitinophaga rhizophila]MBW8687464.1 TetR/AcrR family transcriptional regulator [Chitinophaga rhizophila]
MQDTKERIIGLADQLIKTKGFNAFSYKDISDPLEIKNAAIHYYFPTKTDLGVAVIDTEIERFKSHTAKWSNMPEDKQLKQLFETFSRKHKEGLVCLMGTLSPDYKTFPEPLQEKVAAMSAAFAEWTAQCLENGRKKAIFFFDGDPYDRALLVLSNLLASLLMSRVMGVRTFGKITGQLFKDLTTAHKQE